MPKRQPTTDEAEAAAYLKCDCIHCRTWREVVLGGYRLHQLLSEGVPFNRAQELLRVEITPAGKALATGLEALAPQAARRVLEAAVDRGAADETTSSETDDPEHPGPRCSCRTCEQWTEALRHVVGASARAARGEVPRNVAVEVAHNAASTGKVRAIVNAMFELIATGDIRRTPPSAGPPSEPVFPPGKN